MQLSRDIFACPVSRQPLQFLSDDVASTADGNYSYNRVEGIWQFIPPERTEYYRQFMQEYETVREAEGRKEVTRRYYRELPYKDISGKRTKDWAIRTASLDALLKHVIEPLEKDISQLVILDLGAGNGWLSHQLAQRGHALGAVDLLTNDWDGLGSHKHYDVAYTPLQAEFDALPVNDEQVDLIVYNAALHYSEDYLVTLSEGLRCLKPGGQIAVMDSPIYNDVDSGREMVTEREVAFQQSYGFASNALQSENYLSYERLRHLGGELGIQWQRHRPSFSLQWQLRPLLAKIRGNREPAKFELLVGTRAQ